MIGMAAEIEAAIVCVSHLNKSGGNEAMLRVMGSLGFVAAARAAYLVAKDPDDPDRRLFLPMKNNLAEDTGGLAFRVRGVDLDASIATPCVEWDAERVTTTADEALIPVGDPEERTPTDVNIEWLRDLLAAGGKKVSDVRNEAKEAGITDKALRTAREKLGIKPRKPEFTGGWWWDLKGPEDAQEAPKVPKVPTQNKTASSGCEGHLRHPSDGDPDLVEGSL